MKKNVTSMAEDKIWSESDEILHGPLSVQKIISLGYTKCSHPRKLVSTASPSVNSFDIGSLTPHHKIERPKSWSCAVCQGYKPGDKWIDGIQESIEIQKILSRVLKKY